MEWHDIIPQIISFVAGGGLVGIATLGASKKKADVSVKVDEISALHDTIERVYQPIINQQNERISELETEVKQLRKQLIDERADHQKEIDMMNKRILDITKALGLQASKQIRDDKGRFAKADEAQD